MYIKERDELQFNAGLAEPAEFEFWDEYQTLKQDLMMLKRDISTLKNDIANIKLMILVLPVVKQLIPLI